jgi:glucoamylase
MSDSSTSYAPGWPGIPPRWTSSAKTGAGTALNQHSKVWFTISHGILNEVYFPRVDQACTRDLGFIVTNGRDFFSEEKRHCTFENAPVEPGIPAFELTNTEINGRYRIHKEILTDPYRNVVLQKVRFEPLQGQLSDYRLYALLSPHLANCGNNNTGWVGDYKGAPMFLAENGGTALAFAASAPWKKMSVGFVGASDGWQDLSTHFQMQWEYQRAENGNIACTGEIDLAACAGEFILALGFGSIVTEAGQQVRSSLFEDYAELRQQYVFHWKNWQNTLIKLDEPKRPYDLYRSSTAVLRTHESKDFLGGIIASLSIPWGFSKGDEDLGGYHLIWPRDLVETAGALLAAGAVTEAAKVLRYLESTQEAAGNWAQNLWLDGRPYWSGIQMDETAFPILLVDLLRREAPKALGKLERWWPLVRKAATFIIRNGPVTQQDRWEEDGGYSPFTLAVEISALLAAADIADLTGHSDAASTLRDLADAWNHNIERWVYATGGDLAQQIGVEGYYVRISRPRRRARLSHRQPGFAGPGALRIARPQRPPHPEHHQSHRRSVESPTAARPLLVPLQRRRIRRTPGRLGIRWQRHRPPLAAARWRTRPLRTCRRTSPGRRGLINHDGKLHHRPQPSAPRTSLGCRRYSRARTLPRQTLRLRLSLGLGPLRIHQTSPLPARRQDFRPASANRSTLPSRETHPPNFRLEI